MAVTAQAVRDLREQTGCGMMDCKQALTEAGGDFAKASDILREKGLAKAAKKAGRIASEGTVYALVSSNQKSGVIVEVNSETDFTAQNAEFLDLVKNVAEVVLANDFSNMEELLAAPFESGTVNDLVASKVGKIGENINIRRFEKFANGEISAYIHGEGRIGVLVETSINDDEFNKDIAMHIAAINPQYLDAAGVPADVLAHEKEILKAQVVAEGKPENIAEKIVEGKISKFYKENCLMEQPFIKDNDITIAKLAESKNAQINRFVRFERGEGLEKRQDDLAAEVAKTLG